MNRVLHLNSFHSSSNVLELNIFNILTVILTVSAFICFIQYHWKRRHMYALASKVSGPICLPIIGSAHYFLGKPEGCGSDSIVNNRHAKTPPENDILNKLVWISSKYTSPCKVWLGNQLYYGIWEPDDLKIILNSSKALAKAESYNFLSSILGNGLFIAQVPLWRRHRKLISPAFNQKVLNNFVEIFAEQSEILATKMEELAGKGVFDGFNHLNQCTLDIICITAMGIKISAQENDSDFGMLTSRLAEIIYERIFKFWYHVDCFYNLFPISKEEKYLSKRINDFTMKVIREKKQAYKETIEEQKNTPEAQIEDEPVKRKAFIDLLLKLSEEGANFTDEEFRNEVQTFIIAGTDTSAHMNGFIMMMLGMHQDVQQKVYEEIIDVIGPNKKIEADHLSQLKYLEQVIKETMRILPIAALIGRQIESDLKLDTCTLPAGSSVMIALMALHRNPKYWPNPLKFDPDRFLPEEIAKQKPYTYIPFSAGSRNCIGTKYAMMIMKTISATLVRKLKIYTPYKTVEDIKLKGNIVMEPTYGFKMSVEIRD